MHVCVCPCMYSMNTHLICDSACIFCHLYESVRVRWGMSCALPPQKSEKCEIQTNKMLPAMFEGCQGVWTRAGPSPAEMHCVWRHSPRLRWRTKHLNVSYWLFPSVETTPTMKTAINLFAGYVLADRTRKSHDDSDVCMSSDQPQKMAQCCWAGFHIVWQPKIVHNYYSELYCFIC